MATRSATSAHDCTQFIINQTIIRARSMGTQEPLQPCHDLEMILSGYISWLASLSRRPPHMYSAQVPVDATGVERYLPCGPPVFGILEVYPSARFTQSCPSTQLTRMSDPRPRRHTSMMEAIKHLEPAPRKPRHRCGHLLFLRGSRYARMRDTFLHRIRGSMYSQAFLCTSLGIAHALYPIYMDRGIPKEITATLPQYHHGSSFSARCLFGPRFPLSSFGDRQAGCSRHLSVRAQGSCPDCRVL